MTPGTRVEKTRSEPGDLHQDGARAVVLSRWPAESSKATDELGFGYFVEWDDTPGLPIFIQETRIRAVASV
jgi:hypothetical protein